MSNANHPPVTPLNERRYTVQLFLVDNEHENPVQQAFAVGTETQEQASMLYDLLQRNLQLLTYKPFENGKI